MKRYYPKLWLLALFICIAGSITAQTKDLSLREALQLAAKGNRQLQIQWLESQKAAAAVKEAKSALLPTVAANGFYNIYTERAVIYLRDENRSPKVNDIKFGGRFAFDGYINASYPILNPGYRSNIRAAGIDEQISKHTVKNTEEELALNITQVYLTALLHKEQQNALAQSLQRNEKALQDSRTLFLQGKGLKTDTLGNYIAVQHIRASLSALENNISVLSVQLKQLIGMEGTELLIFTDSLALGDQIIVDAGGEDSVAIGNRKDVKIRLLQIDQSREQLVNTKAGFKPQLTAIAQYQVQNQSDNAAFWDHNFPRTSFAGLKLSIPIYAGNRLKHKTTQSEIAIRQDEIALADLKKNIQTELLSLQANLKEAYDQWNIQQQNMEAAKINYNLVNDRYRVGLSSRLELADAELALTKTRMDQLQAAFSIRMIKAQLEKAMGRLELTAVDK